MIFLPLLSSHTVLCHIARGYWFRDVSAPDAAETPPPVRSEPAAKADIAAEAELYAAIHPRRAARIRALGTLPDRPDFGPPPPELVEAIVKGTGPQLRALDAPPTEPPRHA